MAQHRECSQQDYMLTAPHRIHDGNSLSPFVRVVDHKRMKGGATESSRFLMEMTRAGVDDSKNSQPDEISLSAYSLPRRHL